MFGLVRELSGYADEAETLMLQRGCRGSMLGSYSGGVLRLYSLLHALKIYVFSGFGKFSMIPLQVLTSKIRSSIEETVFMAFTAVSSGQPNLRRGRG